MLQAKAIDLGSSEIRLLTNSCASSEVEAVVSSSLYPMTKNVARATVQTQYEPQNPIEQWPRTLKCWSLYPPGSISSKLVLASGCRSRDLGVKMIN